MITQSQGVERKKPCTLGNKNSDPRNHNVKPSLVPAGTLNQGAVRQKQVTHGCIK